MARELIGCVLTTSVAGNVTGGRIVETEAYLGPDDPACHTAGGLRSQRNSSMYLSAGSVYVYFIYGMHWCFNVVTGPEDFGAAVLIRGLEPLVGIETMVDRRKQTRRELLCSGPARLCQALAIDGSHDGTVLGDGEIALTRIGHSPASIDVGPRIGISKAIDWPLRFTESGSRWLSK